MPLLYWLESIRNPVLDSVMNVITKLGSEALFMVIALTVFWCVNKKEGYYLLFVGFLGTILNQFLKLLYQIPRPWVRDPKFTIVESARADATGYSFPSGHTQNAVGTLGGIARWQKQTWLRVACIAFPECIWAYTPRWMWAFPLSSPPPWSLFSIPLSNRRQIIPSGCIFCLPVCAPFLWPLCSMPI